MAEGGPGPVDRETSGSSREWRRPAVLLLLLLFFSSVRPAVLVGVPYVLLALALPIRRPLALLLAALVAFLVLMGPDRSGFWYAERGWTVLVAGWFVTLSLRWPRSRFTSRALGSVLGAAAVAVAFFATRRGAWATLDWSMAERLRQGVATALEAARLLRGSEGGLAPGMVAAVYQAAETQAQLFPALLALASMAGLGVAWWLYVRVGLGTRGALGPLDRFRFSDHMVWLVVVGLLALVVGQGEGWSRAGSNTLVFMGALYALRGAAVVLFVNGGLSVLGGLTLALGLIFLAPVIVAGAVLIGLGDTWLDIRARYAVAGTR